MAVTDLKYVPGALPEGYVAAPIGAAFNGAPLRVCVLVREKPDASGARLVVLRERLDARVLLGCVVDAGGTVHQWAEVWVQSVDGLADAPAAQREALNNRAMDARWKEQVRAFERIDRPLLIRTPWETGRPEPTLLDMSKREAVQPADRETGDKWRLCEDDALLERAGLPTYGGSLHRYLYLPELAPDTPFVAVTQGAPAGKGAKGPEELTAGNADLIPLNIGAGFIMVRGVSPVGYEAFVDALGGGDWRGIPHGRGSVEAEISSRGGGGGGAESGMFLGRQGRGGRLIEAFYLKLRALSDAVEGVRAMVEGTRRPLLNVGPESFRVRIGEPARGLPFLWTARVGLVDPGEAVALPIRGSDETFFVSAGGEEGGVSAYRPATSVGGRGRGVARIRGVLTEAGELTVLEGTLASDDRLEASRNDLIWLRLGTGAPGVPPVDVYARMESRTAMAAGEWRFRTVAQQIPAKAVEALRAAEGAPLPETAVEVIPVLSSPVDLYALGVLAVRTLVTNEGTTLPLALDEVLSLARQAAADHREDVALEARIRTLFERDPRWMSSLGPQRLVSEEVDASEALALIPQEMWWETLAAVVRMFPGVGPDSTCADLGDARPEGLHRVFDRAAGDLERLLRRSRSLIVIDWRFNREIHAVIRKYLTKLPGAGAAPAGSKR